MLGFGARKPRGRKNRADRGRLAEAQFHDEDTIRRENTPRVGCYGAIAVETIPPAIEGKARIERAHLRLQARNLMARNIRTPLASNHRGQQRVSGEGLGTRG